MPYAVENDIRRHLGAYAEGWPRAGGKPPTVEDGLAYLATAQGKIDSVLSHRGLTVPVTAPVWFLNSLRDLCGMYAAALIAGVLFPQAAGPASTSLNKWLMDLFNAGLKDLEEGTIPIDIAASGGGALARSLWTSHPTDDDGNDNLTPTFGRNTKW